MAQMYRDEVPEHFRPDGKTKLRFSSKTQAIKYLNDRPHRFHHYHAYQCRFCKNYHIASKHK